MVLQVLEKPSHFTLTCRHRQGIRAFEVLGEQGEVPPVGFAGKRAQTLLHSQIGEVLLHDAVAHNLNYLLPVRNDTRRAGPGIKEAKLVTSRRAIDEASTLWCKIAPDGRQCQGGTPPGQERQTF